MSNHDELYPDFKTIMHGDVEMPLSNKARLRDLPPITAAEVAAYTKPVEPQKPRPAITAWNGADMDAYWLDGEVWRHCRTGREWVAPVSLEAATASFCDMLVARNAERVAS